MLLVNMFCLVCNLGTFDQRLIGKGSTLMDFQAADMGIQLNGSTPTYHVYFPNTQHHPGTGKVLCPKTERHQTVVFP